MKRRAESNPKIQSTVDVGRNFKHRDPSAAMPPPQGRSCQVRPHSASNAAPSSPASAMHHRGNNPIWGDDEPLFLDEAAAYTGMPLGTFKQKVYAREIESRLVGKHRKVQPSAVRAYLERHKRPAL